MTGIDCSGVPGCLDCGTCCFSRMVNYIEVFGVDYARMDPDSESLTTFDGTRAFMKMDQGRCVALRIETDGPRFVCSIYEQRPDVCRSLQRGSGHCRGELHTKSERPLLAVAALLRDKSERPAPKGEQT